MQLSLRENSVPSLPLLTDRSPPEDPVEPVSSTQMPDTFPTPPYLTEEQEQNFTIQPTNRDFFTPTPTPQRSRIIPMGMLNRACMNVYSLSSKKLTTIPRDISSIMAQNSVRIKLVQRLDLSNNTIASLEPLPLQQLESLKELLVRQNRIKELPHQRLNQCKQLRLLNAQWNDINVVPPLYRIAFLFLRHNQVKLVTSQLKELKLQGITLDWLQYLIEVDDDQPVNTSEQFGSHVQAYEAFRDQIVSKINFKGQNSHFFDFHACVLARINTSRLRSPQKTLSMLTHRAIMREDAFFLEYLKDYHNGANFASMSHAGHLLLEFALQVGNSQGLQLFQMTKTHYNEQMLASTYLEALKLTCKYGNIQLFEYLTRMRYRKQTIRDPLILRVLIKQTIEKYSPKKDSRQILASLMKYYREAQGDKMPVELPVAYNHRIFKAVSSALVADEECFDNFQLQSTHRRTTSLHFAVRARNDELVYRLAKRGDDVFARNEWGTMCKNVSSSTQTSRKIVWKHEKMMIKKLWAKAQTQKTPSPERKDLSSSDCLPAPYKSPQKTAMNQSFSQKSVNSVVQEVVAYRQLEPLFIAYHKSLKDNAATMDHLRVCAKLLQKSYSSEKLPGIEDYHLRMARADVMCHLLRTIPRNMPSDHVSRIEEWEAIKLAMVELIRLLEEGRDDEVTYQIVACVEMMSGEGRKGKLGSKDSPNFWCCQNVAYE